MIIYIYIYIYIHTCASEVFATKTLGVFWGGKKNLQRQGSSYEAPGAAALNHCLKPPAQVEGAVAGGWMGP